MCCCVHKITVGHRPISALFPSKVAFVRFIVCSSIGNTIAHAHVAVIAMSALLLGRAKRVLQCCNSVSLYVCTVQQPKRVVVFLQIFHESFNVAILTVCMYVHLCHGPTR